MFNTKCLALPGLFWLPPRLVASARLSSIGLKCRLEVFLTMFFHRCGSLSFIFPHARVRIRAGSRMPPTPGKNKLFRLTWLPRPFLGFFWREQNGAGQAWGRHWESRAEEGIVETYARSTSWNKNVRPIHMKASCSFPELTKLHRGRSLLATPMISSSYDDKTVLEHFARVHWGGIFRWTI